MANREVVPEKIQNHLFTEILSRPGNQECADCGGKFPTWASIDFGVFVCMKCSGYHRGLGPSITRVRSTQLDSWEIKQIDILNNTGNKTANEYWEHKMPNYLKTSGDAAKFLQEKYIKRLFVPKDSVDPVTQYHESLNGTSQQPKQSSGGIDFKKHKSVQEGSLLDDHLVHDQKQKVQRKRSISLETEQEVQQKVHNSQLHSIDLLSGDFFVSKKSPPKLTPEKKQANLFQNMKINNAKPIPNANDQKIDLFDFDLSTNHTSNSNSTNSNSNPVPVSAQNQQAGPNILSLYGNITFDSNNDSNNSQGQQQTNFSGSQKVGGFQPGLMNMMAPNIYQNGAQNIYSGGGGYQASYQTPIVVNQVKPSYEQPKLNLRSGNCAEDLLNDKNFYLQFQL